MRSSSTRLRFGGAFAATSVALLVGLGGTAFADAGRGDEHRNERAAGREARSAAPTEDTDTNDGGTPDDVVDAGDNQHPSGKDRSVENGGADNQGRAPSEPDQNGSGPERDNGGLDKPDGPGGVDLADQDGNNGCGNDDDFEDDNEGRCGKTPGTTTPPPVVDGENDVTCPAGTTMPVGGTDVKDCEAQVEDQNEIVVVETPPALVPVVSAVTGAELQDEVPAQVLGVVVERPSTPAAAAPTAAAPATSVRGATASAPALARTGFGTGNLALLAISLLLVGSALVRRPKGAHFIA